MNSLISRGYTSGLIINIDDLSVDSSSTVASIQERRGDKKQALIDGHKRMKGESKIHVAAVTPRSLPIVTGLGPGNEGA